MVSYCWSNGLVVHVPLWSSSDPNEVPLGRLVKYINFVEYMSQRQIVVLICRIHSRVVYLPLRFGQDVLGP